MRALRIAAIVFGCCIALPGQQDQAPGRTPRPFCRLIEHDGGGRLEVLIATYRKGDVTVTLHGALHVADREHYAELQRRFAAFDALLYELIGPRDFRPYPGMPDGGSSWISMVQGGMGQGLQLQAQFDCVDYRQPNFVHADMTDDEWQSALVEAGKSELGEVFAIGGGEPDREGEARQSKVDLVDAFRQGGGTAELRIVMARVMTSPDGVADEQTVIIHGRNERCLEVLQQQLAAGKQQLGIYYGAAHMEHMEQRLVDDLGFRLVSEEWLTAWDCSQARFPKVEKGLRRKIYRARRDLEVLLAAVETWCRAHPEEVPSWATLRDAGDGALPGRADGVDSWGRAYVLGEVDGVCEVRCLGSDGLAATDDDVIERGEHELTAVQLRGLRKRRQVGGR